MHGGPGQATSNLAYLTDKDITTHTMVYYDQRGAGKTLLKNWRSKKEITLELLLEDLHEIVAFIKAKYKKDKVALLGHSWGSLLGTEYIKKYPEDILCYISVGQMVNTIAGEKAGFDELMRRVNQNDQKLMKKIHQLGNYPFNLDKENRMKQMIKVRNLQAKHGIGTNVKEMFKVFIKSPIFTPLDFVAMFVGTFKNKRLEEVDFSYDTSDFKHYQIPIYYVLGENDWQVPSVVAAAYHESLSAPKKAIFWIKNAGHVPSLENTKDFNQAISEILAS